jgi:AraC-like DNA-binding protein
LYPGHRCVRLSAEVESEILVPRRFKVARSDRRSTTHYWRERHIAGLSLMLADLQAHDYAPHMHDAFVIAVTEAGGSRVFSRGVAESIDSRMLFVSNPAETQSSWMSGIPCWRHRSFYLDQGGIADVAGTLGIRTVPYFTQSFRRDPELVVRFLCLHQMLEAPSDTFHEREGFIQAFAELFQRYGSGGVRIEPAPCDRTILRQVVELMRERYAESLRLDDLAVMTGLTPFQLIGLFKRTVGLTPHAYLTQVRLDAARRMLQRGHPIAETAAASGFYDQSALTRHFRRCYGMTPRHFARSSRA